MLLTKDQIIEKFIEAGISSPRLEASMLWDKVCSHGDGFSAAQQELLERYVSERLQGKPICKIINSKCFYKYDFYVDENVLSPRPDTEVLVEKAINIINSNNLSSVLELGVGSGCIILSILKDSVIKEGVGIDVSSKALSVANHNKELLSIDKQVTFLNKSWFDGDILSVLGSHDIIVSNPPYIPEQDISSLDIEVREYDPHLALTPGATGFEHYRQIAKISYPLLNSGGYLLLEVGIGQFDEVINIFENKNFKLFEVVKDLSGIERCIVLKK